MTREQKITIETLKKQFRENCESYLEYGSDRTCTFNLYVSEVQGDDNVTAIITTIDGISDDYEPFVKTANVLIEPDGTHFNLYDLYPPNKVASYVDRLKKIT